MTYTSDSPSKQAQKKADGGLCRSFRATDYLAEIASALGQANTFNLLGSLLEGLCLSTERQLLPNFSICLIWGSSWIYNHQRTDLPAVLDKQADVQITHP